MRVNPNFISDMVGLMDQAQQSQQNAAVELSTGRRVNQPSDNPAAEAAMITENTRSAAVDQYTANSDSLTDVLSTAGTTLSSAISLLNRAITLGTEAANGTNNQTDLSSISTEVSGIQSQMLSLANTSYAGQYLFAGTAMGSAPYVVDSSNPNQIDYVGNSQQRKVQIGTGLTVNANLPGSSVFSQPGADVFAALQTLNTALQSGNSSTIGTAVQGVTTALNAVNNAQASCSSTVNELSNNENFLSQEKLNITTYENTLVSADPAAAAMDAVQAQTVLSSTIAAAAQVDQQANLLNYLH